MSKLLNISIGSLFALVLMFSAAGTAEAASAGGWPTWIDEVNWALVGGRDSQMAETHPGRYLYVNPYYSFTIPESIRPIHYNNMVVVPQHNYLPESLVTTGGRKAAGWPMWIDEPYWRY